MNKKLFLLTSGVLLVLLAILGVLIFTAVNAPVPRPTVGNSPADQNASTNNIELENQFKTYTDTSLGYEFQFPKDLVQTTADIYLPPENIAYPSVKFVTQADSSNFNKKQCYYGSAADSVQNCEAKYSSGISFVNANSAISDLTHNLGNTKNVVVAAKPAIYFSMGAEGEGQEFYFIPIAATKTLIVSRLYRMNSDITSDIFDQVLSSLKLTPLSQNGTLSEAKIMDLINNSWATLEKKISFRPNYKSGKTAWSSPTSFQFIGNNRALVRIEDDDNPSIGILDFNSNDPSFIQFYRNQAGFSLDDWDNIVKKYGDLYYQTKTYSKDVIRNKEVLSFSKLTQVPENVFIDGYFEM